MSKTGKATVILSAENATKASELAKVDGRSRSNFVNYLIEKTHAGWKSAQTSTG